MESENRNIIKHVSYTVLLVLNCREEGFTQKKYPKRVVLLYYRRLLYAFYSNTFLHVIYQIVRFAPYEMAFRFLERLFMFTMKNFTLSSEHISVWLLV